MADVSNKGYLTVIALKKCGSSQLGKAFRERVFEIPPHRYVTAIRHPAARLVSLWYGHVKRRYEEGKALHIYGPPSDFKKWVRWVLSNQLDLLDHHIRPQYLELRDNLQNTPAGSKLFICQLERLTPLNKELSQFCGQSIQVLDKKRHPHPPWPEYFDRELLQQVRNGFAEDMAIWMSLMGKGYEVMDPAKLARQLDKRDSL